MINAYKDLSKVQASGLRLAGQKFFCLNADPRSIYLKKGVRMLFIFSFLVVMTDAWDAVQGDGATIVKTKQAILVAEYTAPLQSGESAPVVEKLADYLISVNY